jgi:hypothetical protein
MASAGHDHLLERGARPVGELTTDDVELLRYLLDLSLQPIDRFDGFSHIEQYLLSALRYQLNYTCYALAKGNRTPCIGDVLGLRAELRVLQSTASCSWAAFAILSL